MHEETEEIEAEGNLQEENLDEEAMLGNPKSPQEEFIQVKTMQDQLAQQMQEMQDMFLSKFKKLK